MKISRFKREPSDIQSSRSNNKSEYLAPKSVAPHDVPLPPSAKPHDVPLPRSNTHAPTAYTASPFSPDQALPSVNIIDYASRQPLPMSRPTTYFANTIVTEIDADGPNGHIHARKQVTIPRKKSNQPDPRQVPLPPSRAPTRARTSSELLHAIHESHETDTDPRCSVRRDCPDHR